MPEDKNTVSLDGTWKFKQGDDPQWSAPDYDDHHWRLHLVPGIWEEHGADGRGVAWYRTWIDVPEHMTASTHWALELSEVWVAAEIYWDGDLLVSHGKEEKKTEYHARDIVDALEETFGEVGELAGEFKIDEPSFLNVAVTNGKCVVAARCTLGASTEAATLYHSEGSAFECVDGVCRMEEADPADHAILIFSEKLTEVKEDWREVPKNHFVIVNEDLSVAVTPIDFVGKNG